MRRIGALALAVALASGSEALAQDALGFSVNPVMARGAATAPVTIVEFSDYQ